MLELGEHAGRPVCEGLASSHGYVGVDIYPGVTFRAREKNNTVPGFRLGSAGVMRMARLTVGWCDKEGRVDGDGTTQRFTPAHREDDHRFYCDGGFDTRGMWGSGRGE